MQIDLKKKRTWIAGLAMPVALGGVVAVFTVRSQEQVEIGGRYLQSVRRGDQATAMRLSSGEARAAVACLPLTCRGVRVAEVAAVFQSLSVETSWNVTTSWGERCVRASVRRRDGRVERVMLRVEELDAGWKVTGVTMNPEDFTVCDER